MAKRKWERLYAAAALAAVCALAVFACLFFYKYDNKYTAAGPRGERGVLALDGRALAEHPVVFLIDGWEYYGGLLLSPSDFEIGAPAPSEYIFIGQYGGFDAGDMSASPHGSASYRLTILLPGEPAEYILELPEIFSAYRAYVNGKLAQAMGDPHPGAYRPETGNRSVRVEASGRIELLVAVSDFSGFYSGLVYPPAFGSPEAVAGLLSARLIFRSLLVAFALAIGILALFIGLISGRNALAVLYGLLCLFFVGYASYPLVQSLFRGFYPFYAIENVSFCAMLAVVLLLQKHALRRNKKRDWAFVGFGLTMCLASAALPFAVASGKLLVMGVYTYLVMGYEWIAAAYLTATSARAVWRENVGSKGLLAGVLVFDASLVMDRLLPMHEPIVTGWFPELASFALALCVGLVVAREVAAKFRDSAVLEERMSGLERLTRMQRSNYEMLNERIEVTKTLHHDLRHHFVVIEGFLHGGAYDDLREYVRKFQTALRGAAPAGYSKNPAVDVLVRHYAQLAERAGVKLALQLEVDREAGVSEADLCAILSNLLENALEACARQKEGERFVTLSIGQKPSMLAIRMENSTDGLVAERDGVFLSSKGGGRKGYGLDSVRAVAAMYGGDAEFAFDNDKKVFVSTALLAWRVPKPSP